MPGKNIVDEREKEYSGAWKLHGLVTAPIAANVIELLLKHPTYFFPWTMILNKLIRALVSPTKEDHWVDIQGYAELVLRDLRSKKK